MFIDIVLKNKVTATLDSIRFILNLQALHSLFSFSIIHVQLWYFGEQHEVSSNSHDK